jgi:hypothetical protein
MHAQKAVELRQPQQPTIEQREQVVPVALEWPEHVQLRRTAAFRERSVHAAHETGRKEAVVLGIEPKARDARLASECSEGGDEPGFIAIQTGRRRTRATGDIDDRDEARRPLRRPCEHRGTAD